MNNPRTLPPLILVLILAQGFGGCGAGKTLRPVEQAPAGNAGEEARDGPDRAEEIARSLDDFSLAAQILMSGVEGNIRISAAMRPLLEEIPLGAYMLFRYNLGGEKETVRRFLGECAALTGGIGGGIPPFMAVDHEGGVVHRFGPGVERLPAALSYGELVEKAGREAALGAVEADAFRSGREIRDLGINLNLAPVAEALTGENRAFLESRSYGPEGDFAAAAAAAFIRGMEAAGIACVVKHFPGNSGTDPHTGRTVLAADRESLDRLVSPFAELLRGRQPSFVMVSHALAPAWDGERIASLSPLVMGGRLRGELGFRGAILADDFSMAAAEAADPGGAVVAALSAGADMVMVWPSNLAAVHRAVLASLETGDLSRERLRDAAARIIREKIRFGLITEEGEGGNN